MTFPMVLAVLVIAAFLMPVVWPASATCIRHVGRHVPEKVLARFDRAEQGIARVLIASALIISALVYMLAVCLGLLASLHLGGLLA